MTGHFTTLDQCERWAPLVGTPTEFYRVPYSTYIPYSAATPLSIARQEYGYRTYKLQSVDFARGLAEYVEVYNGS
jgi:hypothetical protein